MGAGGRLQQVQYVTGSGGDGQQPVQQSQPQSMSEAAEAADEERFASLRRKAGKLARQERRAAVARQAPAAEAPQQRGFS